MLRLQRGDRAVRPCLGEHIPCQDGDPPNGREEAPRAECRHASGEVCARAGRRRKLMRDSGWEGEGTRAVPQYMLEYIRKGFRQGG